MLRKEEFLNAPVQYDYKIEAIEQFLDRVEQKRYEWAITYLPTIVEDVKTLDLNNYSPETVEKNVNAIKEFAEILNHSIYNAQRDNFENKYRQSFNENSQIIMAMEDYAWCGYLCSNVKYLKPLVESDPRVAKNAQALIEILKQSAKDDKVIRDSFSSQIKALKDAREKMKVRKANIKAQKEQMRKFVDAHGKSAFNFNLENVKEGKIEEEAQRYAKLEREYLRKEIYSRTSQYVGKLVDMVAIEWGDNGSLNGIVIGEKGDNARVETIIAGGYNIQCEHYRVLVKPLRN